MLSKNILISEAEKDEVSLSVANLKLATLLLHSRGYVILKNAIPLDLVENLRSAFSTIYQDCLDSPEISDGNWFKISKKEQAVFWEKKSRFRICPKLKPPFNNPFVLTNPFAVPILEALLGKDFYCKLVSSDTCLNGAILQSPHRDIEFYKTRKPYGYIVNIPIMHCGLHNGPLEVWPGGSHLWERNLFETYAMEPNVQDGRNPEIEDLSEYLKSEKLVLEPGDVLIRDPGMWHRGTPNPSDEPRTMLTISYFRRSYFYPYFEPYYNLNRELFENLDLQSQKLFDYAFKPTSLLYWRMRFYSAFTTLEQKPVLGIPVRWLVAKSWAVRSCWQRRLSKLKEITSKEVSVR